MYEAEREKCVPMLFLPSAAVFDSQEEFGPAATEVSVLC